MIRNLDGCYFRAKRDDKWTSVCFTDLEPKEAEEKIINKSDEWLESLYNHLYEVVQNIERVMQPYADCDLNTIYRTIYEIESYNSWRIKVLMIYGLIRYLGSKFDLAYEVKEDD